MLSLVDQLHADGSMSPQERRRLDGKIVNQLRCLSWVDPDTLMPDVASELGRS